MSDGCDTGQDYDPCEGLSMTPKNVLRSVPQFLLGMACGIPVLVWVLARSAWRGLVKRTLRKDIAWIKRRKEREEQ
jgi:hypothetical protein